MFTIEKDDFTGLKKITSKLIGLSNFKIFDSIISMQLDKLNDGFGVKKGINAFDLVYVEAENGQGTMAIRILSSLAGRNEWPNWNDEWPFIIDGERASLNSNIVNNFETYSELKIYELPIDVLSKISNANEVKFSLRGENDKVEGAFVNQHLLIFKSFEQYCFGDENEGKKILESIDSIISNTNDENKNALDNQSQGDTTTYSCYSCKANNIVPNSWESFSCHSCKKDNSIIKPKELTDEERNKHESKVVDLIKDKKIDDAIKYYASNFGFTEADSKAKVKELAEKNGMASVYKKYDNKQTLYGCLTLLVVGFILMMIFKAC